MILSVENINKSFGERRLFENLSLYLEKGKIYSLMGSNGSGKTTLFNILTGFVKVDSGKIQFNNNSISSKSPTEINRLGIARTFQDLRIIHGLTVRENVLMVMEKKMFHIATFEEFNKVNEILKKVSLLEYADHLGSNLSFGQQKLLTLGCCLANKPVLLLLDEPIAGIDKDNKKIIKDIILKLKNEEITILQIEHDMEFIEETSDLVFQLEDKGLKILEINNNC
ncbi:ATP-binding cassette domain-containing protein [Pelodictyon phaeoclathratiforme]|uniref:ABC transporter related n=1 Tax=Pelodictyon phaeoclathratiforme (strain DSM 5477 / BU-1) TaxID=324925 RepID=B4SCN0_PELPB|nr:ATP-binding cassette domain-containing protein [Pelodictyon phaeoclathratiforme]ACF44235.1 ABC transporter related [Pelodictyon phaeoclathratiforme BU-1]